MATAAKKQLSPEEIAKATWRKSPQTVRFYKSKEQARSLLKMRRVIERARQKNAPLFERLRRAALLELRPSEIQTQRLEPPSSEEVGLWLQTPSQAAALGNIQMLAKEILRLNEQINQQNVVYDLKLPPLALSELTAYLEAIDDKLNKAKYAAKRLGVEPVVEKAKEGFKNAA